MCLQVLALLKTCWLPFLLNKYFQLIESYTVFQIVGNHAESCLKSHRNHFFMLTGPCSSNGQSFAHNLGKDIDGAVV